MNGKKIALISTAIVLASILCVTLAIVASEEKDDPEENDVVKTFLEICGVPRCSGNNENMKAYLLDFADKNGFDATCDGIGNVMITHPGTVKSGIVLQAHQDMVALVDKGYIHDFTIDPITTYIKDGCIYADHTTLGADDGTGIAIALCAMKDHSLDGIDFRCIFTVDEETGMTGAKNLDPSWFDGYKYLVNIDSEEANRVLYASTYNLDFSIYFKPQKGGEDECYMFSIEGLQGGHSGADVDKGRGNAIVMTAEFLKGVDGLKISSIRHEGVSNSFPDECIAVFSCSPDFDIVSAFNAYYIEMKEKYATREPGLKMELKSIGKNSVWTNESSKNLVNGICSIPNGILDYIGDFVATSSNIGTITTINGEIKMEVCARGILGSTMYKLADKSKEIFSKIGGRVETSTLSYGWYQDPDSLIVQKMSDALKIAFGVEPELYYLHATTECGELTGKSETLMAVSIGPMIYNPHSTNEHVDIASIEKTFKAVVLFIKNGIEE